MTALDFRLTDHQALEDSARRMAALLDLSTVTPGIADYRRVQERILAEGRIYLEYLHRCYAHGDLGRSVPCPEAR